jgi:chemotaxis protein CheX
MQMTFECVIEQIVQDIYSTMLGQYLARVSDVPPVDGDSLLATIQISGQWMGSVVLSLSSDVARASAVVMLKMAEQDITSIDMEDVAAELVNMIGGNLKSMLPGPSFLSLPTIVSGSDFGLRMHEAQLKDDVLLTCDAGLLRVRLYEKQSA